MKKYIFIVISTSLLIACGGNESSEPHNEEVSIDTNVNREEIIERVDKAQKVFRTLPSPLETATLFQEAGFEYNSSLTSPVENAKKYATSIHQALNLGVYGADLSFANIFDQSQESMLYLNCAKILADELGVTSAFDIETMERIEVNMNNRDSLMALINDAFWIADAHLKENGHDHLSVLIIAGGWIEGLYLGTASLDMGKPNNALMQRIADQKYSLNSLVDLLETYDNKDVVEVSEKLKTLQKVFDKIDLDKTETIVTENKGVATIGGGNTLSFNKDIIIEITESVKIIRDEISL